jgi:uncharacterized YccA/Bax inhibitor family protein
MPSNPFFSDTAIERATGGTAVLDRSPAEAGAAFDAAHSQPAPTASTQPAPTQSRPAPPPPPVVVESGRAMTYGGVTSAAGVMLVVLGLGAWLGWQMITQTVTGLDSRGREIVDVTWLHPGWMMLALLGGTGLAFLTIFKPNLARFTATPYALAEGVVVGCISHAFNAQWNGIALQAVLCTMGVFLVMLVLYGLRILRATPRFVKGLVASMIGIFAMYMVGFVASLFGAHLAFWNQPSALGIGISVVIVIVASLNLIVDFDMIERGVTQRWPAAMDWYGAFGLIITLVWLYLEILRLLALLRQR